MMIERRSMLTGLYHTRDIPIKQEDYDALIKIGQKWYHPTKPIQDILSYLSIDDREFILTGITSIEWTQGLGKEDE